MDKQASALWSLIRNYYEERGLPWKEWNTRPTGSKIAEEVKELIDALKLYNEAAASGNWEGLSNLRDEIVHEIADVVITLGFIAICHDIDIETAIRIKTLKDKGRGFNKNSVGNS